MSYCAMSPRSQLEKYRKRSSSEMRMSVISGGISGSTQHSTLTHGCRMATCVAHWPSLPCAHHATPLHLFPN